MNHLQIKKIQYSPRVFFILHAHVFFQCFFFFFFFFFFWGGGGGGEVGGVHENFLDIIYLIKIEYSPHGSFFMHARAF